MTVGNFAYVNQFIQRILCLLGCICLSSCNGPNSTTHVGSYRGPVNECIADNNCEEGTCHEALSICTVTKSGDEEIFAKVIFNSSSLSSQIFSVPMASDDDLHLELQNSVAVTSISSAVDADVLFTAVSNTLPNKDPSVFVYKTYYENNAFMLFPGVYDVTMFPFGESAYEHPVYHPGLVEISEDGTIMQNGVPILISFPYTASSSYDHVQGRVWYVSEAEGDEEAKDLFIQAYNLDTGEKLSRSREVICLADEHSGEIFCNSFYFPLPSGTVSVGLRLFKPNEPFYPAYIHRIEQLGVPADDSVDVPRMDKPVLVEGVIEINSQQDGASPTPRCRVLIERLNDDNRQLAYWVASNDRGRVERVAAAEGVYLYPGEYRVTAYPISDDTGFGEQYTVTQMDGTLTITNTPEAIEITDDMQVNGFVIELDKRFEISGDVEFAGEAIPQVTITAYNIETQQPYARIQKSVSGSEGLFDLWLDSANYFVTMQAPVESNYAVGTGVWNVRQSKTYSFTGRLQTPFVIEGKLDVDKTSQQFRNIDIGSVSIEWYKQFGQNVYLVARSSLGSDGSFYALLPPN